MDTDELRAWRANREKLLREKLADAMEELKTAKDIHRKDVLRHIQHLRRDIRKAGGKP